MLSISMLNVVMLIVMSPVSDRLFKLSLIFVSVARCLPKSGVP
jgi:hypothetical protein